MYPGKKVSLYPNEGANHAGGFKSSQSGPHQFGAVYRRRLSLGCLAVVVGLFVAQTTLSQIPAWWANRGVIVTNQTARDFSPLNQGQLKWMVSQAALEFSNAVPNFAVYGSNILNIVHGFSTSNNYQVVNIGQLKYLAQPFYDFLWTNGCTNASIYPDGVVTAYPWSGLTNAVQDFSMANAGQAKYVFSFDLAPWLAQDDDGDGLSNGEEIFVRHTNPRNRDTDHDGFDDAHDPDPTNALNGAAVLITSPSDGIVLGGYE